MKIKKWLAIGLILLSSVVCFAATTDFKVDNVGSVYGYKFISKDSPVVNVTHPSFGADPTGTVDSQTAIQAAINYAETLLSVYPVPGYTGAAGYPILAQGAIVYFPRGTYLVSGTLTVSKSNIWLVGDGWETSRLYANGTDNGALDALIVFQGATVATTGQLRCCGIKDLMLYTSNSDNNVRRRRALRVDFGEHFTAQNVFYYCFGYSAIQLESVFESYFQNQYIGACGSQQGSGADGMGVIAFNPSAIYPSQCNNTVFDRLTLAGNFGKEIEIYGSAVFHSNLQFRGVSHEMAADLGGAVSDQPHIRIKNAMNVLFDGFQMAFGTAEEHDASEAILVEAGTGYMTDNIVFQNGLFDVARSALPKAIGYILRTAEKVTLQNITIHDPYGMIGQKYIETDAVTTAKVALNEVYFDTPKALTGCLSGSGQFHGRFYLRDYLGANVLYTYTYDVDIDMGDLISYDFTVWTNDTTWRDLDLSGVVGVGARDVYVRILLQSVNVGDYLYLRTKGNSNTVNALGQRTQVTNQPIEVSGWLRLDSNRKLEYAGYTASAFTTQAVAVLRYK